MIAHVVGVRAVDDVGHFLLGRHAAQDGIEFVLAEITTIRRVVSKRFIPYLVGVHDDVANPDLRRKDARFLEFGGGQGDGAARDGERSRAQNLVCDFGQKCAVHARRERDQNAPHLLQGLFEVFEFYVRLRIAQDESPLGGWMCIFYPVLFSESNASTFEVSWRMTISGSWQGGVMAALVGEAEAAVNGSIKGEGFF